MLQSRLAKQAFQAEISLCVMKAESSFKLQVAIPLSKAGISRPSWKAL